MSDARATVFVGRRDEVAALDELASDVMAGTPRVVWIEGPAGAGKTALLRAVDASLQGFTVARAEAEDGAGDMPMWLLGQLVPHPPSAPFAAGLELLDTLAERQADGPVAMLVEDLHWGDGPSRQALLTALQRLQHGDRVLAVLTSRNDALDDGWRRFVADEDRCRQILLGPLSVGDVGDLAHRVGVPLAPRAARALHAHTAGHALHVRTLLSELTPEELHVDGPLPAPRSLAAATVARVASLPAAATELVAALAVLGGAAPLPVLADVSGVTAIDAAAQAASATGLVGERDDPVPALAFTHPLHRTAVYDDLSPTRRRALHLAASRAVADPVAARWHRVRAADRADDELAAELEATADAAGDAPAAVRLLTAAADLSATPADASRRVLRAARVAAGNGDVAAVRRLFSRLASCPQSAERDLVLGWLAWQEGEVSTAERWLRDAAGGPASESATRARAWLQLGAIQALNSRGAAAIASAEAALRDEQPLGDDDRRQALLTVVRGTAQVEGGVRGLEVLAEHFPDPWGEVAALPPQFVRVRGMLNLFAGRPDEAIPWFTAAIGGAGNDEIVGYLAHMHMMRAQCHHWLGAWDDARLDAHRAVELAIDLDQRWTLPQAHAMAARLEAAQGRLDAAAVHVEQLDVVSRLTAGFETVMLIGSARAEIARVEEDHAGVVDALEPVFGSLGAHVPLADYLQYWPAYVDALIDTGRIVEATESADAFAAATAARRIDAGAQVVAFRARMAAAAGRGDEAVATFDEALGLVGPRMNHLDHALLLHRHGRLLRSVGQRGRAVELLRRSRDLLSSARATPYLQRVDDDLAEAGQAGAEPQRRSRFDLTDRERDVASLVARGLTNKEVAAELYVSTKAVEYHLGNIFAKLSIDNRRQLRDALAAT